MTAATALERRLARVAVRQDKARHAVWRCDLSCSTDDEIEALVVLAEQAERAKQTGRAVRRTAMEATALERLGAKRDLA